MTLFLKMYSKQIKPETLQNQVIKETFAKSRMWEALSINKKMQIFLMDDITNQDNWLCMDDFIYYDIWRQMP